MADNKDVIDELKEKTFLIEKLLNPVEDLLENKPISGVLLFLAVVAALIWGNVNPEAYHHLWETPFKIIFGDHVIDKSFHHWINDGLMAVFFFSVGLEIKREILLGELSSIKKASLPIAAAIGGMIVPALFFALINNGELGEEGWGIPMATDIAFTLGILSLLGKRVPTSLKIFLTALAIVDDLGAVLVIAFFYTENVFPLYLEYGLVFFVILGIGNVVGVRSTLFYSIIGICGLWTSFLLSGVHATLAGVILAMTIPVKAKINEPRLIKEFNQLVDRLKNSKTMGDFYVSSQRAEIMHDVKKTRRRGESPLQKMEHALNPFVSFIVLPLFAFSNSGIEFEAGFASSLLTNVSLGVLMGLVLGKPIGIVLFSFIMVKIKASNLPIGVGWFTLIGAAIMAGIGFTMSIFIAELAFDLPELITQSKMAILLASLVAGIVGLIVIKLSVSSPTEKKLAESIIKL